MMQCDCTLTLKCSEGCVVWMLRRYLPVTAELSSFSDPFLNQISQALVFTPQILNSQCDQNRKASTVIDTSRS
jgi:hypothetical protein